MVSPRDTVRVVIDFRVTKREDNCPPTIAVDDRHLIDVLRQHGYEATIHSARWRKNLTAPTQQCPDGHAESRLYAGRCARCGDPVS